MGEAPELQRGAAIRGHQVHRRRLAIQPTVVVAGLLGGEVPK
jgi:hypothetical protein